MNQEIMALISMYGPVVVMCLVFYFLLYRPQKAEQQKRSEMLANLHKGNRVMTVGGIYGEIVSIKDNVLEIQIADKVVIKAARTAVSKNLSQGIAVSEESTAAHLADMTREDEKPDA